MSRALRITELNVLSATEDGIVICSLVLAQYRRLTDRQKRCSKITALSIAASCETPNKPKSRLGFAAR